MSFLVAGCEAVRPTLAVLKRGLLAEPILMPGGRTMEEYSEVFVGLDVAKDRHAVASAESGRTGEVRYRPIVRQYAVSCASSDAKSTIEILL